jgi:hypothetical protein
MVWIGISTKSKVGNASDLIISMQEFGLVHMLGDWYITLNTIHQEAKQRCLGGGVAGILMRDTAIHVSPVVRDKQLYYWRVF